MICQRLFMCVIIKHMKKFWQQIIRQWKKLQSHYRWLKTREAAGSVNQEVLILNWKIYFQIPRDRFWPACNLVRRSSSRCDAHIDANSILVSAVKSSMPSNENYSSSSMGWIDDSWLIWILCMCTWPFFCVFNFHGLPYHPYTRNYFDIKFFDNCTKL